MSDLDLTPYRAALAIARKQLAEKEQELRRLEAERDALDIQIRKLRAVVYNLGLLCGEPVDEFKPFKEPRPMPRYKRSKPAIATTTLLLLTLAGTIASAEPIGISYTHRDCITASSLPASGPTGVSWSSREQPMAVAFADVEGGCAPTIAIPVDILEWSESDGLWTVSLAETWRALLPAKTCRVQLDIHAYLAGLDHVLDPDGLRSLVIDLGETCLSPDGRKPAPEPSPSVPEPALGLLLLIGMVTGLRGLPGARRAFVGRQASVDDVRAARALLAALEGLGEQLAGCLRRLQTAIVGVGPDLAHQIGGKTPEHQAGHLPCLQRAVLAKTIDAAGGVIGLTGQLAGRVGLSRGQILPVERVGRHEIVLGQHGQDRGQSERRGRRETMAALQITGWLLRKGLYG